MNYIDQIFERCDKEVISSFLLYGAEPTGKSNESFYERRKKADEMLCDWLGKQFPDAKAYDKQSSFIYSVMYEMENLYMQFGMKAGIKLALEFYKR